MEAESAEDSAAGTSLLHLFREGDEQITTELLWLLAFLTAKDEAESNAYLTALLPELLQVQLAVTINSPVRL